MTPANDVFHVGQIENPFDRRMTAAVRASGIGVFEFEPQTGQAFWDDRIHALWGIPVGEDITYDKVVAQVHPEETEEHDRLTAAALDPEGDGRLDFVYRVFPRDGQPMRWIHAMAECYFEDGKAVRLVGTVQDVTAQKTAEKRNMFLLNELEHRIKNTLSVAIAVVNLSRSDAQDLETYASSLDMRLHGLAESHDLLRANDWSPVAFADLLMSAVGRFTGGNRDRFELRGAALMIAAEHVMILNMGIHELLTNAAKYGALSVPDGRVVVEVFSGTGTGRIVWSEHGAAPGGQPGPSPKGFGSILLDDMLPAEFGGRATRRFGAEGLIFEFDFPLPEESAS